MANQMLEVEVAEAFRRTFVKGNIPEIHPTYVTLFRPKLIN